MRQENYLIALFNKDLLDLRVPLPQRLKRYVPHGGGKGKMLTQALEWNLRFCLMEYLFDKHGRVRKVFLKSKNRVALIEGWLCNSLCSLSPDLTEIVFYRQT
jgi:autophagy-related protein 9